MLVMDVTPAKAESKTPVNFVFCFVLMRQRTREKTRKGGEKNQSLLVSIINITCIYIEASDLNNY